jgi:uncharacterized membrane protein
MSPRRWARIVGLIALLIALPLADGHGLMGALWGVGYTVCDQIPSHSFFIDGQQLPLCARCTGIYLGFLVGLLGMALLGKLRASRLPPRPVTLLLLLAILAMAADGMNSVLGSLPGTPQAYEPSNTIRLATGMAAGISLALLLVPLANESLWAEPSPWQSVADLEELAGYAVMAALATVVVAAEPSALLYPIATASVVGVFLTLTTAGTALAATLARRGGLAASRPGVLKAILTGFALAIIAMAALGEMRAYLPPLLEL